MSLQEKLHKVFEEERSWIKKNEKNPYATAKSFVKELNLLEKEVMKVLSSQCCPGAEELQKLLEIRPDKIVGLANSPNAWQDWAKVFEGKLTAFLMKCQRREQEIRKLTEDVLAELDDQAYMLQSLGRPKIIDYDDAVTAVKRLLSALQIRKETNK